MANPISNFLFGSPQTTNQLPLFSPEQQAARQQVRGMGLNSLQNNPLSFAPIKQQYEKQFSEQVIPTLAERFAGNLRSSAFKGALGNTASDFYSKLAGLESQYNLGARQQGLRELLSTLNPEFQTQLVPEQPGLLGNLASSLSPLLGGFLGGPLGSQIGGSIGQGISGLLQNLNAPSQQQELNPNSLAQLLGGLNISPEKIQQIMNILGVA